MVHISLIGTLLGNIPHGKRKTEQVSEQEGMGNRERAEGCRSRRSWGLVSKFPGVLRTLPLMAQDPAFSPISSRRLEVGREKVEYHGNGSQGSI